MLDATIEICHKVNHAVASYRMARTAMVQLKSKKLDFYLPLEDKHLTINKDITEENRHDQRHDIMPWFWIIRAESQGTKAVTGSWLNECK